MLVLFLLNVVFLVVILGVVSSSGSVGRLCGVCNLGSMFVGWSVSGRVLSFVYIGFCVYVLVKFENSNESNLFLENLEEEIEII